MQNKYTLLRIKNGWCDVSNVLLITSTVRKETSVHGIN